MAETFHRFNDRLYQFCIWVSAISIVVMSMIIPWGIFARYVLGTGSRWPEPVAILLMVLFTFLGSAVSYRAGAHIAVAMVTDRLPEGVGKPLRGIIHLLMLAVALFMLYYGTTLCIATWHQSIGALPWMPVGLTYTPVPIAGFITALFVIEVIFFGSQKQREVITLDHLAEEAS
jgi:TRAP-type C4-dicarboxylate transport system permease small subunit